MNILIIGATSGIGKALFVKYANADNRIGIVGPDFVTQKIYIL